MQILILGGGVFLGAAALDAALARGHAVTVFNRGRARSRWPAGVAAIGGDRRTDLAGLAGRRWDAVIDTCGYVPADVRASAAALRASGRYLFVSSVSAYATTHQVPIRETDPLAPAGAIAPDDRDPRHYGVQKAACEAEVERVFGARALLVRPGLIVGPGDRSGRFSHWPLRAAAGGAMAVPDVDEREPLQFIDVRDLGGWLVTLLEDDAGGAFNATGPTHGGHVGWRTLVETCRAAAAERGLAAAEAVPIAESFLAASGVAPWTGLPLWLPSADPDHAGFNRIDVARAQAAGLRTRPLRETVDAVLDEAARDAGEPRRGAALTREREAQLVAAWRAAPAGRREGATT